MRFPILAAVLATSLAASAHAADNTVDLQLFHPAPGANNLITVETGDVNTSFDVDLGLTLDYARRPLAAQMRNEDGSEYFIGDVVGYRLDAVLLGAIGLFNIGEIGFAMPFVTQGGMDSSAFEGEGLNIGTLKSFTQGDLRLVPKIRFLHYNNGLFSGAFLTTVVLPTAAGAEYASEAGVMVAPTIALSSRSDLFLVALDLGYRFRKGTRVEASDGQLLLKVDDEIFAKLGIAFDVNMGSGEPLQIVGELFGQTPANMPFAAGVEDDAKRKRQLARTSLEGDLGLRATLLQHLIVTAGVGFGLTPYGYGQPVPRVFAGLMYYSGQPGSVDTDRDGVPDSSDKCPNKKEDRDGFQDNDGCPDLDNDGDGVLDEDDQCPNEPEDRDQLGDEDGCPETDFDGDGILDEKDKCPKQAEDKDGFQDEDGCPDLDNDGDGIADAVDKCPNEPEDKDGFQDVDGCPDPDNDGDGLSDLGDMCPNFAEDKDGVADDDGCPEDNDGDGIEDALDKCPNQAETYNGVDDEDGCPEKLKLKSLVKVTEDKIEIKETIHFRTGSAKILRKSFNLLDQVVSVLRNYKHINKVRIEGHTDSRGSRRRNIRLSRARAQSVREYLVDKGIDPSRLDAQGYGPDKPIASNRSARGREKNRRVEFMIVDQTPPGQDVSQSAEPVIEMEPALAPNGGTAQPASPAEGDEPVFEFGPEPAAPPAAAPEAAPAPAPKKKAGKKQEKKDESEIEFDF